jgi:hypothetical protein
MRTESKRGLHIFPDSGPEWFVRSLNKSAGRNHAIYLGEFIRALNLIDQVSSTNSNSTPTVRMGALHRALGIPPATANALGRAKRRTLDAVNSHLDLVKFSFRLLPTQQGWKREWKLPERYVGPDAYDRALMDIGLAQIGDLACTKQLAKVRECDYCKQWFVAVRKRRDNRFCSVGCRSESHRKTPEGRRKRTEYMRGYRSRLRARDRNNLRIASRAK